MNLRSFVAIAVLVFTVSCVKSGDPAPPAASGNTGPAAGGRLTLAAEQWPQCLNPITSCSNAAWLYYTAAYYVFPRLVQWDAKANMGPSDLIMEVPTLENGGIARNPFTVTYHLNPKAVWSDGTPITSSDIEFTWKAILFTTGSLTTAGYDSIESIGTADPHTVVIQFKKIYVDWPDLFGGSFGFVLKKSAFPSADPNKPDLAKEMNAGIPFSGGPWIMQSWTKDQEVFIRNPKYWGHQPYLDQVTMVPRTVQQTEIAALLSGEVAAIFPQPTNTSLLDQFKQNPQVKSTGRAGADLEALWMNTAAAPFDNLAFRKAFAYAMDRQTVINDVIKLNNPDATVNNCPIGAFPGIGPWCDPGNLPLAAYNYDPPKAKSMLASLGYAVGADGICVKDGKPLSVTLVTTAGNSRRQSIASILKEKATAACVDLKIKFMDPTDLFSNSMPKGTFQVALYATGALDPSPTSIFSCKYIPTAANGFAGNNQTRWCHPQATALMEEQDKELDVAKRAKMIQQIGVIEAQDLPALPLEQMPRVTAWRSDKIAGPVGDFTGSDYGVFFNMDQWYIPRP